MLSLLFFSPLSSLFLSPPLLVTLHGQVAGHCPVPLCPRPLGLGRPPASCHSAFPFCSPSFGVVLGFCNQFVRSSLVKVEFNGIGDMVCRSWVRFRIHCRSSPAYIWISRNLAQTVVVTIVTGVYFCWALVVVFHIGRIVTIACLFLFLPSPFSMFLFVCRLLGFRQGLLTSGLVFWWSPGALLHATSK